MSFKNSAGIITIVLIGLIVALISSLVFVVLQFQKQIAVFKGLTNELSENARQRSNLAGLLSDLKSTQTSQKELDLYIIDEKKAVSFIEAIEFLGKKTGTSLSISSVSIENEKVVEDGSKKSFLIVRLRSVGSFGNLAHLLELIEYYPAQIAVDSVLIRKLSAEADGKFSAASPMSKSPTNLIKNDLNNQILPTEWIMDISFRALNFFKK